MALIGTAGAALEPGASALDRERRDRLVRDRADRKRVGDRADADGAAEQEARDQHARLDRRAHDAHRMPASGDARAEPVARPRAEPGADVEAGRDAVARDAAREQRDA